MSPQTASAQADLARAPLVDALERNGFALWPALVPAQEVKKLAALTQAVAPGRAGLRCPLGLPWCAAWAARLAQSLIESRLLAPSSRPVQCTYFDKTLDHNWLVSPHQDLNLPLRHPVSSGLWRAWSHKEGQYFAQPPQSVLEQCLALRLHLDPCANRDGALRIAPGSHKQGILTAHTSHTFPGQFETCLAQPGDALLMRPLALHASSKRTTPGQRRVLHFVFGPAELPGGAQWPDWHPSAP